VVDLPAARKVHEAAASDVARTGQDCLRLGSQIEEQEVEKQQLLVRAACASCPAVAGKHHAQQQ
jgi:hypothetical protein